MSSPFCSQAGQVVLGRWGVDGSAGDLRPTWGSASGKEKVVNDDVQRYKKRA